MSRYHSYINSAKLILEQYRGEEPFSSFLKKFFAANKRFGSRDRKHVSHLCYCYFRLGKALPDMEIAERILIGLYLCSQEPNEILESVRPDWNLTVTENFATKLSILNFQFSISDVFPWRDELGEGIDHQQFSEALFIQPDLFLRVRPGRKELVYGKLRAAGINYCPLPNDAIALANASKIDSVIELDRDAVIQDLNSQRVGEFLHAIERNGGSVSVWDCCAASGGKSILAKDILGDIDLVVSDIRESIITNLKKRFLNAGISRYHSFIADLTAENRTTFPAGFDLVICDAPCSGSGTWGRTPEQLFYFDEGKIDYYAALQSRISTAVLPSIKAGGYLLYITCSVFKKENENIVKRLESAHGLRLKRMELLKGYDQRADTLYAALLQLPL